MLGYCRALGSFQGARRLTTPYAGGIAYRHKKILSPDLTDIHVRHLNLYLSLRAPFPTPSKPPAKHSEKTVQPINIVQLFSTKKPNVLLCGLRVGKKVTSIFRGKRHVHGNHCICVSYVDIHS